MLKDLTIKFSEEGSSHKPKEAATWFHFVDFLDECDGKATNCCKCTYAKDLVPSIIQHGI